MENLKESIEELKNSGASTSDIIDALLELDRDIRDLGCDFTEETLREAKNKSKVIYKAISEVDAKAGELLITRIDN
jgi:hypothetical protein